MIDIVYITAISGSGGSGAVLFFGGKVCFFWGGGKGFFFWKRCCFFWEFTWTYLTPTLIISCDLKKKLRLKLNKNTIEQKNHVDFHCV